MHGCKFLCFIACHIGLLAVNTDCRNHITCYPNALAACQHITFLQKRFKALAVFHCLTDFVSLHLLLIALIALFQLRILLCHVIHDNVLIKHLFFALFAVEHISAVGHHFHGRNIFDCGLGLSLEIIAENVIAILACRNVIQNSAFLRQCVGFRGIGQGKNVILHILADCNCIQKPCGIGERKIFAITAQRINIIFQIYARLYGLHLLAVIDTKRVGLAALFQISDHLAVLACHVIVNIRINLRRLCIRIFRIPAIQHKCTVFIHIIGEIQIAAILCHACAPSSVEVMIGAAVAQSLLHLIRFIFQIVVIQIIILGIQDTRINSFSHWVHPRIRHNRNQRNQANHNPQYAALFRFLRRRGFRRLFLLLRFFLLQFFRFLYLRLFCCFFYRSFCRYGFFRRFYSFFRRRRIRHRCFLLCRLLFCLYCFFRLQFLIFF